MRRLVASARRRALAARTRRADSVTLDFDDRNRRRLRLLDRRGRAGAARPAEGRSRSPRATGSRFEDGGWLAVRAAAEDVLEIAAADRRTCARLAWHLGNRHLPAEIAARTRCASATTT